MNAGAPFLSEILFGTPEGAPQARFIAGEGETMIVEIFGSWDGIRGGFLCALQEVRAEKANKTKEQRRYNK